MVVFTRGNGFKLKKGNFRLYIGKIFFMLLVMRHWSRFQQLWIPYHWKCSRSGWVGL